MNRPSGLYLKVRGDVGVLMAGKMKSDGSFTVELALLMPIILCVISSIIYMGFYMYDYHRLTTVVEEGISKTSLYIKHESNIDTGEVDYNNINQHFLWELYNGESMKQEKKLEEYLVKKIGDKFFIMERPFIQVDLNLNQVTIQVSTRVYKRIPFGEFLFPNTVITSTSKLHHPTQTLRQGEVIVQTGMKIKGVGSFVDQLEEFLSKN